MNIRLLLLLFCFYNLGFSQVLKPTNKADTLIPFFGDKPLRLHGYNNRVIPFGSKNPLHVLITFEESNNPNFEYFRIDSTSYLVQEYFRDNKGSSNDGIKSRGKKEVKNNIIGKSISNVKHIGGINTFSTKDTHYLKGFTKEGEWEEYEDSVFHHIYWKGFYKNDKRVGLWKRILYGGEEDYLLEETNYDIDSTLKIYSANIIKNISTDSLQRLLKDRWSLRGCDAEKEPRMFYSKCHIYDGNYGDDCNNKWATENYYDFISITKFVRQRGEGCNKFRESCISGQWKVLEIDGNPYLQIKYTNGQTWKLKILYLDKNHNLITDRQ